MKWDGHNCQVDELDYMLSLKPKQKIKKKYLDRISHSVMTPFPIKTKIKGLLVYPIERDEPNMREKYGEVKNSKT
jgi:hypothetical protein